MNIKYDLTMDDFIEMENLELKYYSDEHVTPHEEAYQWHLDFPETSVVLEEEGKIIAFLDMMPIRDSVYEGIRDGVFNDKYLTIDDMVNMERLKSGDSINLLLSCIVIDDGYRKSGALRTLLNTQLDYFLSFVNKGIRIEHVITSNVTKDGERFSEKLKFRRIGTSHHHTALYLTSFQEFAAQVRSL